MNAWVVLARLNGRNFVADDPRHPANHQQVEIIVSLTWRGTVHYEYVPEGQTANQNLLIAHRLF